MPKDRLGGTGPGRAVAEDVGIEDFRPPEWRAVLNRRADLGEYTVQYRTLAQEGGFES